MNRNTQGEIESRKGSVSVLLMVLLSSVIFTFILLYDNAAFRTLQTAVQWNGNHSGNTVLTYYLPELKERYNLYGIWKEPSLLEWRMRFFVEENSPFWMSDQGKALLKADLEHIQVDPEEYLLMDPQLIQGQICDVMEQGFIIDMIQQSELVSRWKEVLNWVGKGMELSEENAEASVQRSGKATSTGDLDLQDSSDSQEEEQRRMEEKRRQLERDVNQRKQQGESAMKEIVLEDGMVLENAAVISKLPSRQVTSSEMQDSWEILKKDPGRMGEIVQSSLGTDLYALHYFGNYVNRQDGWFLCQIEYILHGELSDEKNLEKTKRDLFLLRTGLNVVSVYRDPELNAVVGAMAAAAAPIPYSVAFGLLAAAVSAAEAGEDVRTLMNGGNVPALKASGDWLSFSDEMDKTETVEKEQGEISADLTYENHLHLLLVLKPQKTKIVRMMDLIQLDLQRSLGESFAMNDLCGGFQWKLQAIVKNSRGKERLQICEGISRYGS